MLSDTRIRQTFRLALFVCVLAIAWLAFAPPSQAPGTPFDKLNHVLAFAVLAWLADMAYPGRHLAKPRWAFLLGYGLTIEVIQGFLPYRELSLLDFGADAVGILCYDVLQRLRGRPRTLQATAMLSTHRMGAPLRPALSTQSEQADKQSHHQRP